VEIERGRVRFLAIALTLLAMLYTGRLFYVQIVQGSYWSTLADSQYEAGGEYGVYERGSVFFQDRQGGKLTAAGLDSGFILSVNPDLVEDPNAYFEKLKTVLPDISEIEFKERASKVDDPYEEITGRLPQSVGERINELELPGVALVREQWRTYPAGDLAAHVLGFVGYQGDRYEGQYGVEKYYEARLRRDPGDLYQNFFSGLFSGIKDEVFGKEGSRDADVVLSIEPSVQRLVESKTEGLMEKWEAKSVGIIVLDPSTGAIIAMSANPNFDPNNYGLETDPGVFSNPFVEDVFEMGSIMKPITMAAALDEGAVKADTKYFDKGYIELDGKTIGNYDGKGRGEVDMQDVLNQSLNTGVTFAAHRMGKDNFRQYMYRFGFHEKTGIDLPGETGNLVDNLESNRDVEIATASFGQGIAVSPISMVRALGALGNGGFLIKPHVVSRLEYKLGYSEESEVTEQGRAISRETSDEITRMLVKVVDEHLAAGSLRMENYSIAAKTGTAQIANPDDGGYYEDRFMHSFFGYFPAYDPEFLVFLYMYEPKGADFASQTLTEPFGDIAEFLISYYEIPPDR